MRRGANGVGRRARFGDGFAGRGKIKPGREQRCRRMGIRGRQAAVMTRVMMQRAQLMMVIERMIEFMCGGNGSDQQ